MFFYFFIFFIFLSRSPYCLYFPLPPLRGQPTAKCHPIWQPFSGQQSTVGWGDCWIWTQDCSFKIWCRYQWATTAPISMLQHTEFHESNYFRKIRDVHVHAQGKCLCLCLYPCSCPWPCLNFMVMTMIICKSLSVSMSATVSVNIQYLSLRLCPCLFSCFFLSLYSCLWS